MGKPTMVLTDEQQQLRAIASDLFSERASSGRVRQVMLDDGVDRALWTELARMGLLGLLVPEEQGGTGGSFVDVAVVAEQLGRRVAPVPFLASAVLATTTVLAAGRHDQVQGLLSGAADGSSILALAHLDRGGTFDAGPGVRARREDDGWVLDGAAGFVLAGSVANVVVTAATTDEGLMLFAVPAETSGVSREAVAVLDLTRPMATVTYEGAWVPAETRLDTGDPAAALDRGLRAAIVALAAEQVGGAQQVLEMTTAYAKERIQFGRAIGSFQAVKHRLAEALVKVESARSVARYAAQVLAAGDEDEAAIAVPMAKSLCSEVYETVAADGIQLHGGIGFTWEHDAHLYLKRAKASKLLFGGPHLHRRALANALGL